MAHIQRQMPETCWQAHERLVEAAPAMLDALKGMIALTIQLLARKDLPAEVRTELLCNGNVLDALNAIAAAEGLS